MGLALPGAVAGTCSLNWFFTPPYGTLVVESARAGRRPDRVPRRRGRGQLGRRRGGAAHRRGRPRPAPRPRRCPASAGAPWPSTGRCATCSPRCASVFGMRRWRCSNGADGGWAVVEVSGAGAPARTRASCACPPGAACAAGARAALFAADRRVLAGFADGRRRRAAGPRGWPSGPREAAQLEAVDRLRTALLAGVGHDLRTPLAGDQGRRSAACASATSPGPRRSGPSCWRRSRRPPTGCSDWSAICSTRPGCRPAASAPSRAGRGSRRWSAAALLDLAASTRSTSTYPRTCPDVLADPACCERVLANVLDNALRTAARPGERPRRRGTAPDTVVCDVIDHGPGVPAGSGGGCSRRSAPGRPGALGDRGTAASGWAWPSRAGSPRRWAARLTATATPGGGLTMRLTLPRGRLAGGVARRMTVSTCSSSTTTPRWSAR